MIKNYFKIAWRNLLKNKLTSLINILGLASGMCVAIMIGLWIHDELSFNDYHQHHDELAQVYNTQTFNGNTSTGQAISIPLREELATYYGEDINDLSLASWNFEHILAVGDKKIIREGMYVEPAFPDMMTLKMIHGNVKTALQDPGNIILSASVARALFGKQDPMNKLVKMDNNFTLKVSGVYEDLPANTELHDAWFYMAWDKYYDVESWINNAKTEWDNHSFQLFVRVKDKARMEALSARIRDAELKHNQEGGHPQLFLHPMNKWHLYSEFKDGKIHGGRIQFVWMFGIIGVFVLLLACINFMNLSTARSEKRAREVGIRKSIGSLRSQLIAQFLSESLLVVLLSASIAIILSAFLLPFFNRLAEKQMQIPVTMPAFWMSLAGFTLFTGLLAGSYPAFYLSSFNPLKVLKGTFRVGRWASLPRKVLVVLQFTVSVALIIGTIIVFNQIQHAKNRPINYSREGLIRVDMNTPEIYKNYEALRNDLLQSGYVYATSESSSPVTDVWSNQTGWEWEGKDPNQRPLFGTIGVSFDFGKSIGWEIIKGRDFSRAHPTDSFALVMNEAAEQLTGLQDIIGKTIKKNDQPLTVIGVVKNMVMQSPYEPIQPTMFMIRYNWVNLVNIRLMPGKPVNDALAGIETIFKKHNPGSPFEYKFVDEEYESKFATEMRVGQLAKVFAILAVFISCLGLLGLSAYVAEQRTKEIGIRKVLGASLSQLWMMLTRDFVLLTIISCIIATPIALYFLNGWLNNYDYRIHISWVVFVVSAVMAVGIALCTVSYQVIRAAMGNPVKSLRSE